MSNETIGETKEVEQELVGRISWDYNQLIIGHVCKLLDELAAKVGDGAVVQARRKALIDVLDYLESVPHLNKRYVTNVVSQVQVTDLPTTDPESKVKA